MDIRITGLVLVKAGYLISKTAIVARGRILNTKTVNLISYVGYEAKYPAGFRISVHILYRIICGHSLIQEYANLYIVNIL